MSVSRLAAKAAAILALLVIPAFAFASGSQPYDAGAFRAAQDAGKPVLVEIHADWCPECKAQERVMDKLDREPAYARLARFRVDYDHQKDLVKAFKARMQSTLVLYKGRQEVARLVGETHEDRIKAMLNKAL